MTIFDEFRSTLMTINDYFFMSLGLNNQPFEVMSSHLDLRSCAVIDLIKLINYRKSGLVDWWDRLRQTERDGPCQSRPKLVGP